MLLQNHLLAKLSAALQVIHHRYNSSQILTPIGPSVRHVQLLETQLGKMDQHYDECNSAMATGEVNGYDDKFLSYIFIYLFISVACSGNRQILTFPVGARRKTIG